LKESRHLAESEAAYRRAVTLKPDSAEAHLQLGHILKMAGRPDEAALAYGHALEIDPACEAARMELGLLDADRQAASSDPIPEPSRADSDIAETAEAPGVALLYEQPDHRPAELDELEALAPAGVVFDVSDLVAHFHDSRRPSGIQRIQIEVIATLLRGARANDERIGVCVYAEELSWWVGLPGAFFLEICDLALSGGVDDAARAAALAKVRAAIRHAKPMEFRRGGAPVNLGTSWWLQNYFLAIRNAKDEYSIRYIPFVHDLIPIVKAEYCIPDLVLDFVAWASGIFEHADHFLVNSQSTKRDLVDVACRFGKAPNPEAITVVALDADFRKAGDSEAVPVVLGKWGLAPGSYVLFVSTIEPRKNHIGALSAWLTLLEKYGAGRMPKLVCAGRAGWNHDGVYARLESSELLKSRVVMLQDASDEELALLYANCQFTLYPSHYEGWGLPVTESLCYGKPVLLSTSSSMPEAGGEFADYFEAGSDAAMVAGLERLMFDRSYRKAQEQRIRQAFHPRNWLDIANQIAQVAQGTEQTNALGVSRDISSVPEIRVKTYYPMRRRQVRIGVGAKDSEVFRAGKNWGAPNDHGVPVASNGGRITLRVPGPHGRLRAYFGIRCAEGDAGRCRVDFLCPGGLPSIERVIAQTEKAWVACDFPASAAGSTVDLTIFGLPVQDTDPAAGTVSILFTGFYLCEAQDLLARTEFLEAALADDMEHLEFATRVGGV
jgi:glycosyltransferase involved in cell wall biosynthesis